MTNDELRTCYLYVPGAAAVLEFTGIEPKELLEVVEEVVKTGQTIKTISDGRIALRLNFAALPLTATSEPPAPGTLVLAAHMATLRH